MGKYRLGIILFLSFFGSTSCTNSKGIRIPNPKSYELNGNEYFVVLKSGKVFRTEEIKVKDDTAYFKKSAIPIREIKAVETRSPSLLKTFGLGAGIGSAIFALGLGYAYFQFAYGRTSEK